MSNPVQGLSRKTKRRNKLKNTRNSLDDGSAQIPVEELEALTGGFVRATRSPRGSSMMAETAAARFLAFGDSLTAGYHSDGLAFLPYAGALASTIGCPASAFTVCGASGLQATQLVHVLESDSEHDVCGKEYSGLEVLCRRAAQSKQYEVALIMLGTNDLAEADLLGEVTPESICRAIRQLHQVCHGHGIRTATLPIPPNKFTTLRRPELKNYQGHWRRTNELLETWASGEPQTIWVDVTKDLPWSETDGCWESDGLHLSPAGSEKLGQLLGSDTKLRQWLLQGCVLAALIFQSPRQHHAMQHQTLLPC